MAPDAALASVVSAILVIVGHQSIGAGIALRVALPAVAIAMVAGTDTVNNLLNSIPEVITRGLQVAGGFIVVVGYAMVINLMNAQKLMVYFFLGFLLAVFTDVNLIGFGAIGAICAYFHIKDMQTQIAIQEAAMTGVKVGLIGPFVASAIRSSGARFDRCSPRSSPSGRVSTCRR